MKLKKPSCCCGATKSNPCVCMKNGPMKCSSKEPKCPCYKEKDLKKSFDAGWSVVMLKGWEEDWDKAMWEIDNTPSDMCKLCKKDMNDPANLAPYQHEAMLETGAFPDYCIHCQKEYGLSGDF